MDNDKKNILDDEKVQKMKDDVTEKIADAASEVKDEIADAEKTAADVSAAGVEQVKDAFADAGDKIEDFASDAQDGIEDALAEFKEDSLEAVEAVQTKAKSINMSPVALAAIIVGCVAAAALIVFLVMHFMNAPKTYGAKVEGKTVATVNNEKITDADLGYFINQEAQNMYYQIEGENATGDLSGMDWDQDYEGRKLSDVIKENALNEAIDQILTVQKGTEMLPDEEKWTEEDDKQIQTTVAGYVQQFGEDGFAVRAKSMGIPSANEYARMYKSAMQYQAVMGAMEQDLTSFTPEGVDLSKYTKEDRASVKHILIKVADPAVADPAAAAANPQEPAGVDDATALATATTVAQQAKAGGDFDQLMTQYNQDTGETSAGYTFKTGEMVPEFEKAAFGMKIDEVSDPVKSEHGYHVIKRIAGMYEIQGSWREGANISSDKGKLDKISVQSILQGVQDATDQLQAEQAAQAGSQGAAGGQGAQSGAAAGAQGGQAGGQ